MSQKKIFIVDDNEMFAEMLKDRLTNNPSYRISVFNTGEECIKNLYLNPDLIILDYFLNDVFKEAANGLEILGEIKRHNDQIHVIMLSSQEKYTVAAQTISKGAEQYVVKDDDAFYNIGKILRDIF
ncbi:MAG: response regulator [Bacteroidales bacterium]|nr:response regulator [Bacteroidales bacterium]